ncbi:MAG: 3-oxoadipate enol-lactonase [Sulfuritalea sp.]|nr:3-oxoadipate enol-lactonase [Sulfuritalea sp.]
MNTINVNGITIRYTIEGSGPWVTLSHSLACDLTLWDELTAVLKKHFTVLRYDTRGHGGTSLPKSASEGPYSFEQLTNDLLALLDVLKVERSHFVGISMGGMIGQHLALAEPQRLGRLVLANTTSRVPPEAGALWEERFAQVRAHGTASLAEATLERWFTAPFRVTHPQLMARVTAMIAATSVAGYIGCGEAIRRLDISDRLDAIKRPTLVIVGADDPGTPPAASEVIARAIPGARLEVIPAASHLSCLEQPEVFNRLVADFLGS